MAHRILVIDDEAGIRRSMQETLEHEGYKVELAADGKEGLNQLSENRYDAVFCDIKMPKMDGIEVLEKAMEQDTALPFIIISAHGDVETAVDAVKKGAFDFIEKPLDLNRLLITVRNALDKTELATENKALKRSEGKTRDIIGESPAVQKIKNTIDRVAGTDARVLITGDNGTGKELVARWIHEKSPRGDGPLTEVNCAAIPSELIESELFGHEKGSFTSAVQQRIGKFEKAHKGTLFLDEIGDMSLDAQAKVLRVLEQKSITRIGGNKEIPVDVRVIAATNKDLNAEIEAKRFRLDLYHRLSVILIHVPSLNEREKDIPLLAERFLDEVSHDYGMPKKITKAALNKLKQIRWTGNIRELRNVVERLTIMSEDKITAEDVDRYATPNQIAGIASDSNNGADALIGRYTRFQDFKDAMEKRFIAHRLKVNNWNVSKTAEELDIQRSHLYNKIEKFGLKREQ